MYKSKKQYFVLAGLICSFFSPMAHATYWNMFNAEGESSLSASIVTYDTMTDMLSDSNRSDVFTPDSNGVGNNIVGSASDGAAYWNVFNVEGESGASATFVTYDSLFDMLTDSNRADTFIPDSNGVGCNIVGSGSDGTHYWNVFNEENESLFTSVIVTYDTLIDMLLDTNRSGAFFPDENGVGKNIVGSGSGGLSYWNVFNEENESDASAAFVTYATYEDMLSDSNRTGVILPNDFGIGRNGVGSGADLFINNTPTPVPEPSPLMLMSIGLTAFIFRLRRDRKWLTEDLGGRSGMRLLYSA